jgi:spermidine synthase
VLAYDRTRLGVLSLFRRHHPGLGIDLLEVRLGDEHLMSSLFTAGEIALATLGLGRAVGEELDVVVGGLGLGYTAHAALDDARVATLQVVEALPEVISWHVAGLVPDTAGLADDGRVELVAGDFFAMALGEVGLDPTRPGRMFDVILLDVDHTPDHVLDASHAALYTVEGLRALRRWLTEGGVFALWSDDAPEQSFLARLAEVFDDVAAEVVDFPNRLTGGTSSNTVYLARRIG